MAYSVITHTAAASTDHDSVTTGAVDTTGASLIYVVAAVYDPGAVGTLADSKGNTWTESTRLIINNIRVITWYSRVTSVGSGHTFTFTGSPNFPAIAVLALSGATASPFDSKNSGSVLSGTSLPTGSVTPAADNEVLISGIAFDGNENTLAIDNGFTISDQIDRAGGNNIGVGLAYKIQTTAVAVNPSWSWSVTAYAATELAAFSSAAVIGVAAAVRQIFVFP